MVRMFLRLAALIGAAVVLPSAASAQAAAASSAQRAAPDRSSVLFRVFLTDGRVLSSYG